MKFCMQLDAAPDLAFDKPNLKQNVHHVVGLFGTGQVAGVIFDMHLLQSIWQEKTYSRGAYKMTCWVPQTSST